MKLRYAGLAGAVGALLCLTVAAAAQAGDDASKPILYYIPHTHWEGAVFKTREEYLEIGLPHILEALALLKKYPDFKFTLDQVAYFKPFLERYPEEAANFRKYVAEGRLQIVGGMDVMPDVVKPGAETFVRQMQYGKLYCRQHLGVDVTVAWLLDTFGHHPQMPQLLKLAGFKSFWFCRGVPNDNLPSEFFWRGIDGTEIPTFWLPGFYGLFYGPPRDTKGFATFFKQRYDFLTPHVNGPERVGLAGVDVSEPEDYAPPLVEQYNRQADRPFTIRYAVPTDFEKVVARRKNTPVLTGDFDPIFQGTYSSRIELKQTAREIETQLLNAEKLGALSNWLKAPTDDQAWKPLPSQGRGKGLGIDRALWRAWEPLLFNQTHDLASGVMTDHVYEDVQRGYDFSKRLANAMVAERWERIAAHIDTRGKGVPVVVFNPSGWPRTDSAEVEVNFSEQGVKDVEMTDASGAPTPIQITRTERYSDGGIRSVVLSFVAREIPALGYATYHLIPRQEARPTAQTSGEETNGSILENEFYRVTVDRATGAVTSVFDKKLQWEALRGPGNVVARQQDKGDLWELYRGLDGGSHIAMTNRQPVPTAETAQLSAAFAGKESEVLRGPVFSEFRVSHPFGAGSFATRVRLYAGVRRLDITTELTNNDKFVRYQVLFPTAIKNGKNVQEIPFGALERPVGIEFPAQQWADYGDGSRGIALLNHGMPGNLVSEDTLMLSLMRSHTIGGYGFGGGYEPGMSSDTGLELGKTRTFHYALVPHEGDWRQAAIYREGIDFNQPLLVHKAESHAGSLPARWGLVEISPANVVLTACKPGPGGAIVLRVYEAAGTATKGVKIKLNARILSAREANLLEDAGRRLDVRENTVQFDLHPFEIKTLLLRLAPAQSKQPKG